MKIAPRTQVMIAVVAGMLSIAQSSLAQTLCNVPNSASLALDAALIGTSSGNTDVIYATPGGGGALLLQSFDPRSAGGNVPPIVASAIFGGQAGSEPTAVSRGPGRTAFFVRGKDNRLYANEVNNGSITGYLNLGGAITYNPSAVTLGPGNEIVFARGSNQQLVVIESNNSVWGPWQDLGGVLRSSPVAVSMGPGHVAVFVQGTNNTLYFMQRVNGVWSGWLSLGGSFVGDPIAVSRGLGTMDAFVKATNNTVMRIGFDGAWSQWQSIGTPPGGAFSEPGAAFTTAGELVVFERSAGVSILGRAVRPIYRNSSFDGGVTWSGWIIVTVSAASAVTNPEATANTLGGWTMAAPASGAGGVELQVCATGS